MIALIPKCKKALTVYDKAEPLGPAQSFK